MSSRISTYRVGSEEIQGPDSFVTFRHMSFGTVVQAMDMREKKTSSKAEKEFTEKLLRDAVIEWNWVDDTGVSLPLPSAGLEIESLLTSEVMWLVDQITGKSKAKNSSSGSQ